jgi:hypothetical protein
LLLLVFLLAHKAQVLGHHKAQAAPLVKAHLQSGALLATLLVALIQASTAHSVSKL